MTFAHYLSSRVPSSVRPLKQCLVGSGDGVRSGRPADADAVLMLMLCSRILIFWCLVDQFP